MSTPLITAALPPELFGKVPRWFWRIGKAGQRLFLELWFRLGFKPGHMRVTDWQIAGWCGMDLRWAQKALRQLLDVVVEGVARPLIRRYKVYGRRDVAGRVVEIIVDFVGPAEDEDDGEATRPARPAAGRRPKRRDLVPNVPEPTPPTPEQLAAAAAAQAAANAPAPEPSPEEAKKGRDFFDVFLRRSREKAAGKAQAAAGRPPAPKLTPEELRAQIAARKAAGAGPVPGPDPGAGNPPQPAGP